MNKLQNYIDLGVQELSVTNGQAVAVNPYEYPIDMYYRPEFNLQKHPQECFKGDMERWEAMESKLSALPPLPCAESVKEGRYPIDRFEEVKQHLNENNNKWVDASISTYNYPFFHSNDRTLLILSEPVAESEKPKWRPLIDELKEARRTMADEVAEKPEGGNPEPIKSNNMEFETEYQLGQFRKEQKELFDETGKAYRGRNFPHSSAELMLNLINQLEKELSSSPPEAEPVESAEEIKKEKLEIKTREVKVHGGKTSIEYECKSCGMWDLDVTTNGLCMECFSHYNTPKQTDLLMEVAAIAMERLYFNKTGFYTEQETKVIGSKANKDKKLFDESKDKWQFDSLGFIRELKEKGYTITKI